MRAIPRNAGADLPLAYGSNFTAIDGRSSLCSEGVSMSSSTSHLYDRDGQVGLAHPALKHAYVAARRNVLARPEHFVHRHPHAAQR
eukprot:3740207-Pleurochrysis_carterae.AAC.1